MATFEESFVYPLYLLLIAAGASVGIGTWLSHWLESRRMEREIEVENRRKELEIKVDLASKMFEVISYQEANSNASVDRRKKTFDDDLEDYYKNVRKWYMDVNIISSKLEAYFAETTIRETWEKYYIALLNYSNASADYFYEDITGERKNILKDRLEQIREYFSKDTNDMEIDWNRLTTDITYDEEQWRRVGYLISRRGDEIAREVLKLPIKAF
jgi:hypothetical protein